MNLTVENMDLFTVSTDYCLAHCISSDFVMGKGIAYEFRKRGVSIYLMDRYSKKWDGRGYCLLTYATVWKGEFNLITKEKYWNKPTLSTLRDALEDMKSVVVHSHIDKIAMPRIGCGLDRLQWADVESIIREVFDGVAVDILVCDFKK